MTRRNVALALVALGAALLVRGRVDADGWLWTGLVGIAFLVAYRRQRVRGLLVVGCLACGVAAGLLFGGLGVPGAFMVAVGVAVMAIDRVEPEADKRTLRVGAGLTAFGLLLGVASSGWLDDWRFAAVLVLAGALLLAERGARRGGGGT